MIDYFDYHGHMCISFDMLGLSVFDFLVSSRLAASVLLFKQVDVSIAVTHSSGVVVVNQHLPTTNFCTLYQYYSFCILMTK